jgi:hypothetical protein
MADTKAAFLWSIGQQESGGNYTRVNSSSGALGKYQVMPSNLSAWTKAALGHTLTPQQFLSNPSAQEAVANKILGGYYDTYGAKGAAAMWYSGQSDPTKTYGKPPVYQYVNEVVNRMNSKSPTSGSTPASDATPAFSLGDIPGVGSLGDDLAKGLTDGIISAFKSIMGPVLQWAWWLLESGVGIGAMVGGAFLIAQKSGTVQKVERAVLSTSGPEGKALADAVPQKKVRPAKAVKPERTLQERQEARQAGIEKRKTRAAERRYENARVDDMTRRMKEGRENG